MDPLIVAFSPGTSGRFICAISHMMTYNLTNNIKWTEENSAHNYEYYYDVYWTGAPAHLNNNKNFVNTHLIYKYLHLTTYQIMPTHAYPNFKLIEERNINCKIIIIGWCKDNFTEIAFNNVKKNNTINPPNENHFNVMNNKFISLEIPDNFKDKTQVIMYDEIYQTHNDSFVGLNKIAKFLNKSITESVLNNYKLYVEGRNQMLQENDIAKI